MKTRFLATLALLAAAAATTSATCAASNVSAFVRPTIGYTKPADSNFDGAAVFGLAGGVTLGEKAEHEFSLEFLFSGWTTDHYAGNRWLAETTVLRMPILANYRYYVRPANSIVSFYAGAGIGMEIVSLSSNYDRDYYYDYYGYGYEYGDSDSSVAFAAAGTAGISIKVSRMVEIEVGYRGMWQSGGDNSIRERAGRRSYYEFQMETDSGWVHFVTAGVSVRF